VRSLKGCRSAAKIPPNGNGAKRSLEDGDAILSVVSRSWWKFEEAYASNWKQTDPVGYRAGAIRLWEILHISVSLNRWKI
jgi:hypothetical protein